MNCKQIKELILTDYLDDELNLVSKGEAEGHIKCCSECAEYLAEVSRSADQLFKSSRPLVVPEWVWSEIKTSITARPFSWKDIFYSRTLNVGIFSIAAMLLAVFLFSRSLVMVNVVHKADPIESLTYISDNPDSYENANYVAFGSSVEELL